MMAIIIWLVVVGILLYLVNTYVPMDGKIKNILNTVVVIVVILWLLQVFGVFAYIGSPSIPRLHR